MPYSLTRPPQAPWDQRNRTAVTASQKVKSKIPPRRGSFSRTRRIRHKSYSRPTARPRHTA